MKCLRGGIVYKKHKKKKNNYEKENMDTIIRLNGKKESMKLKIRINQVTYIYMIPL